MASLQGANRRYLAFGAGLVGALFLGLIVLFSLTPRVQEQAKPTVARVRVTSTPPGAQIFVAGVSTPRNTPFEIQVPYAAGYVDLVAQQEGYETTNARVMLQSDILNQYNFALTSVEDEMATLEVHVYPPESRLFIDGQPVEGSMPFQIQVKANSPHVLRLSHEGYATRDEEVRIEPQGFRKMSMALDLLPDNRFVNNTP